MADIFSKTKRSDVMSRIHGAGNKDTELALANLFRIHRITGWRRQIKIKAKSGKRLFTVRPDFIFPKLKFAIFVDGCFWHGCPRHATRPKSNRVFWDKKLSRNRERDRFQSRALRRAGWMVIRIWECALHRQQGRTLSRLQRALIVAGL
jgi:DNA mismatch endonuclease, patch repair protein